MLIEEEKITNNYSCSLCKTDNNKWHKLYYKSDGEMLIEVKSIYLSFCKTCNKPLVIDVASKKLELLYSK
jgi:hypothetical protein